MNEISSWILITISKKWSTYSEYFILQFYSTWNVYMKNVYDFHNAYKGEYKYNDISYDQLGRSVGISNFEL